MKIHLFGLLREAAANSSTVVMEARPGEQVGQVLERLATQYPKMRPLLLERPGHLVPFTIVALNGRDVRHGDGLATVVQQADELAIFLPSAGG